MVRSYSAAGAAALSMATVNVAATRATATAAFERTLPAATTTTTTTGTTAMSIMTTAATAAPLACINKSASAATLSSSTLHDRSHHNTNRSVFNRAAAVDDTLIAYCSGSGIGNDATTATKTTVELGGAVLMATPR